MTLIILLINQKYQLNIKKSENLANLGLTKEKIINFFKTDFLIFQQKKPW